MKIFCLFTSAALLATGLGAADFHDHLGIQLYSLREQAKESTVKALDLAAGFGFSEVETAGTGNLKPADFAAEARARNLTIVATHASYEALNKGLAKLIADAKVLGARYIILPWLPHGKDAALTVDEARKAAVIFNTWGAMCRAAGLQFGFHPHGFEFKTGSDGTTPFDVLVRETKPELVAFEMDVFWVVHAGVDPVKLLLKYPDRWRLMHVKDIRKGAVTGLSTGSAPSTDKVAIGNGEIDWHAVLGTAEKIGVKHYFIEDEGTQPLKDIPASVRYLEALQP